MHIIIVNPTSGNGRSKRIYEKLLKIRDYQTLHIVTYETKYAGHGEVIARALSEQHDLNEVDEIIVIGGDGTLHEVLNGLETKKLPVSFIPGGSGNDFARGNKIHRNARKALQANIVNDKTIPYWLGKYSSDLVSEKLFVNCIGFGFDALVAENANKSRVKRFFNFFRLGTLNYVFAIFKVILTYKPFHLTLKVDGLVEEFEQCFLATVNNQPYLGGGMKFNPAANNEEETLSILVINAISKWKLLLLLLTVFFGKHTMFKEVHQLKGREIHVKSDRIIAYHTDGETSRTATCYITKEVGAFQIKGTNIT